MAAVPVPPPTSQMRSGASAPKTPEGVNESGRTSELGASPINATGYGATAERDAQDPAGA
eukprot:scaffold3801_cov124-Isochrysis_galbana.AAC.11